VTSSTPFLTLAMRGHVTLLKSMSGTGRFTSVLNKTSMRLHSKLGSFLRIKTKVIERLRAIRAVNGATHSQKDNLEANGGSILAEII